MRRRRAAAVSAGALAAATGHEAVVCCEAVVRRQLKVLREKTEEGVRLRCFRVVAVGRPKPLFAPQSLTPPRVFRGGEGGSAAAAAAAAAIPGRRLSVGEGPAGGAEAGGRQRGGVRGGAVPFEANASGEEAPGRLVPRPRCGEGAAPAQRVAAQGERQQKAAVAAAAIAAAAAAVVVRSRRAAVVRLVVGRGDGVNLVEKPFALLASSKIYTRQEGTGVRLEVRGW